MPNPIFHVALHSLISPMIPSAKEMTLFIEEQIALQRNFVRTGKTPPSLMMVRHWSYLGMNP